MAWDFETDPEFQKKLDWIEEFMRDEVEPLSYLGMAVYFTLGCEKFIRPLQQKVKDQGLWACHLGPELGGQGFGQLKLALMNEKLGRNGLAPSVFGCQAPDSGNAEILSDWFHRAIPAGYKPAYPALERFLMSVGRRKFIGPLYAALAKTPEGLAFAREHPAIRKAIFVTRNGDVLES